MTLLTARGVSKRYGGVTALAGVDLEIDSGHIVGLLGANGSGKSTLSAVISGETRPSEGGVIFDGKPLSRGVPREARAAGVVIAHQHPGLAPDLPVWENVFLGAERCRRGGFIDRREARSRAAIALESLRSNWQLDAQAGSLGAADQQLVEIAKALVLEPRLLILDEPTAALAAHEVDALLRVVKELAANGTAIIFISHRMAEIEALCDRVIVLCSGKLVGELDVDGALDEPRVLAMMQGLIEVGGQAHGDAQGTAPRRANTAVRERGQESARTASATLTVSDLRAGHRVAGASFSLRRGDVLGIGGLQGHGQEELLDAIAGFLPHESGSVTIDGERVMPRTPRQMIAHGVCLVPNDRHRQGLWLDHSVEFNLAQVSVNFGARGWRGWRVDRKALARLVQQVIDRLSIKTSDPSEPVRSLSGGNQQKIVIGRWLDRDIKVLLLSDPTKGVDVIARQQIYDAIHALARAGVSVVLYASDTDELLAQSDRVIVMYEGRVATELEGDAMNEDNITRASFGRIAR